MERYQRHQFPRRYRREDIELLAAVEEGHETLSGPAQRLVYRAYYEDAEAKYKRVAALPVAQLHRMRGSRTYRNRRVAYEKARPTKVAIGERRQLSHPGEGNPPTVNAP